MPAELFRHNGRTYRKQKMEESVERLKILQGVVGVMVTTENWIMLMSTFDEKMTMFYQKEMKEIETLGTALIRDSEPDNGVRYMTLQFGSKEILLAIGSDHRVLVVYKPPE